MLGHPLKDFRTLFEQLVVALLRTVFNPGKKQFFYI